MISHCIWNCLKRACSLNRGITPRIPPLMFLNIDSRVGDTFFLQHQHSIVSVMINKERVYVCVSGWMSGFILEEKPINGQVLRTKLKSDQIPPHLSLPMTPYLSSPPCLNGGKTPKMMLKKNCMYNWPVASHEPYKSFGDNANLCFWGEVEVELCNSHHNLNKIQIT